MVDDLKSFKIKLGKRIKNLRERKFTQLELGALIGKDYQSVSRIENGRVNPSAFLLYQLADALDVTIAEIFDFSDIK